MAREGRDVAARQVGPISFMKGRQGIQDRSTSQSQADSLNSFNVLVRLHQEQIYNLALRMLGNSCETEEVTRHSIELAWRQIHDLRDASFKVWLFRIVSEVCLARLKGRPATSRCQTHECSTGPVTAPMSESETVGLFCQQLLSLPPAQRLVVILADLHGLTYEEIAWVTRSDLRSVGLQLGKGRTAIRDRLLESVPGILGEDPRSPSPKRSDHGSIAAARPWARH